MRSRVDGSCWPLLRVKYPKHVSDDNVRAYLDQLRSYREREEPYGLLSDSLDCLGFRARQRQMQGRYIASSIELTRKYLKAFAFVAGSAWQRGMLTAVFWIQRPESPYRVCSSVPEAEDWVLEMLDHAKRETRAAR